MILWWGGFALIRRELSYNNLCHRFDMGIGILFFLLFIGAGAGQTDQPVKMLIIPFFFSGMLAIALGRNRDYGEKSFLLGYRGIGLVLGFISLVLFSGAAVLSFFLPYLTATAENGYQVLRAAGKPAVPYLLGFIRFLFGFGFRPVADRNSLQADGNIGAAETASGEQWSGLWPEITVWGFMIVFGLLAAVLISWGLWRLFLLLQSRTAVAGVKRRLNSSFLDFLSYIWAGIVGFWRKANCYFFKPRRDRGSEAEELYSKLKKWGKAGGLPPRTWETPSEYGIRLSRKFPELAAAIKLVVDCFNREVYGETTIEHNGLISLKRAWHSIAGSRNWLARIKIGGKS